MRSDYCDRQSLIILDHDAYHRRETVVNIVDIHRYDLRTLARDGVLDGDRRVMLRPIEPGELGRLGCITSRSSQLGSYAKLSVAGRLQVRIEIEVEVKHCWLLRQMMLRSVRVRAMGHFHRTWRNSRC